MNKYIHFFCEREYDTNYGAFGTVGSDLKRSRIV
jgi:hypothetical protein